MIQKIIKMSALEQLRSPVLIIISLLTAPLFVLVYTLFFTVDEGGYNVLYLPVNQQNEKIITYLENWNGNSEQPILEFQEVKDIETAKNMLTNKKADILLILPDDFVTILSPHKITLIGDMTLYKYSVAAIIVYSGIEGYLQEEKGLQPLIKLNEESLTNTQNVSEFDLYIPGLMVFSLIILIFQVAMNLSRLVESGIIKRLRLTRASTFSLISGHSLWIIIVGLLSFFLTLIVAYLFGSSLSGNWLIIGCIALLTAMSITGLGMIIAAFSKTTSSAFIIANFPLMILMFFSGSLFPIRKIEMFSIGSITVGLFDILPTSHAVTALHKVMVLHQPFSSIIYEMTSLVLLTALYTWIGVSLFYRKQIKVA